MSDPYNILQVDRSSSPGDIKKSYRRLAKKYHPDRNQGDAECEKKFKEIQEAYQVLSDPKKKEEYDNPPRGFGGFAQQAGFGGFGDIFSEMFGGNNPFNSRRHTRQQFSHNRQKVVLSFDEAAFGCEKDIVRTYRRDCHPCEGTGAGSGGIVTCETCNGSGEVVAHKGFITVKQTCPQCGGHGKVIKDVCRHCDGTGKEVRTESLRVSFPAGVNTGNRIRLDRKGDEFSHGACGDLFLDIHALESDKFVRDGCDIRSEHAVDYPTYVLGGTTNVVTVKGERTVRIPTGTPVGSTLRLRGEGLPNISGGPMGDHYATLTIDIPKDISEEHSRLLSQVKSVMT